MLLSSWKQRRPTAEDGTKVAAAGLTGLKESRKSGLKAYLPPDKSPRIEANTSLTLFQSDANGDTTMYPATEAVSLARDNNHSPSTLNPACGYAQGAGNHFAGKEWQIVVEERVIPLKSGSNAYAVKVATMPDVTVTATQVGNLSSATTLVHSDYKSFVLPIGAAGEYRVNGVRADNRDMVWTDTSGTYHFYGEGRMSIAVAVRKSRLIRDIAAIVGVDPEDICLDLKNVRQSKRDAAAFRRRLSGVIEAVARSPERSARAALEDSVLSALANIVSAQVMHSRRLGRTSACFSRIVSAAEECYVAAGSRHVSLADLCQAAGVSKSSLHAAFVSVSGVSPMEYFLKRRLIEARERLVQSAAERGCIKRAALESGFTELGRFAVRYRELFGESPSETVRNTRSEARRTR